MPSRERRSGGEHADRITCPVAEPGETNLRPPTSRAPLSFAARSAIVLIVIYRHSLSFLLGRRCRYEPTCSLYTQDAIARHGFWGGGWMGLARMCRCHPWGASGYDPVPDRLSAEACPWRPWTYGDWRGPRDDD